jgi:hypothetical protein
MKGSDRFLIVIVVGALVVAGAAAATTLWHRSEPTYRADAAPEAVAYNFLLALQKQDYARAYTYISPQLAGYPRSVAEFASQMGMPYQGGPERNATVEVEPARITGDLATVGVRETFFYTGGLFNSGENTINYPVLLQRVDGTWLVINGGNHWNGNWKPPEPAVDPRG